MAKFRKRPVVIDAAQFWNDQPFPQGVCDCTVHEMHLGTPHIHTLEGVMDVNEGDWIITGVKGECHPCKPDIFAATYDAVEEPAEAR